MDSVISQLQSAGLIIDGMPHVGRLVRCKVDSDTGRKESGWYVLHDLVLDNGNHVYVGRYGNWKTMGDESLPIEFDKPVSALDKERIAKQQRDIRENAEMEKRLRAESAAKRAKEIWEKLPGAGASQYLMRKRVGAHGLRFSRGSLVVPVHTTAGELVGLQFIAADGSKKFLTGTAKKGCFHRIGRLGHGYPLCICEGYATGASIWEVMDWPVAIAFDAGNFLPVAKALREKYPDQKIIICADNDCATPGNPGVTKAREAAVAIGAQLAVPVFPEGVAA